MNTPLLHGSKMVGLLRTGVAFLTLFLLVGLGQSFAQAQDYQLANTLSGSSAVVSKNSSSTQAPSNTIWLSAEEATDAIKARVSVLSNMSPTTASAEAEIGLKARYYSAVLDGISNSGQVADEYNNSFITLAQLSELYNVNNRPELQLIRESLLDLLSQ